MRKTKEHKRFFRKNRMFHFFWTVIWERRDSMMAMNRLTGEFRVVDK